MEVAGKVVVVTGGGNGIGKGLCERFHAEGAAAIVVVDLEQDAAEAVATAVGGDAYAVDVRSEEQIAAMVAEVESKHGRIDLFCSNAGIIALDGEQGWATSASNDVWQAMWDIHVMSHVWAARWWVFTILLYLSCSPKRCSDGIGRQGCRCYRWWQRDR